MDEQLKKRATDARALILADRSSNIQLRVEIANLITALVREHERREAEDSRQARVDANATACLIREGFNGFGPSNAYSQAERVESAREKYIAERTKASGRFSLTPLTVFADQAAVLRIQSGDHWIEVDLGDINVKLPTGDFGSLGDAGPNIDIVASSHWEKK